jgi:hypothetical protein
LQPIVDGLQICEVSFLICNDLFWICDAEFLIFHDDYESPKCAMAGGLQQSFSVIGAFLPKGYASYSAGRLQVTVRERTPF